MNIKIGEISVVVFSIFSIIYSVISLFAKHHKICIAIAILSLIFSHLFYLTTQKVNYKQLKKNLIIANTFHNPAD